MTLLTYHSKYLVPSATTVTTSSSALSDDTPATQTFSLASTKTVLIIYTANSEHLSTNGVGGMKNAINVDGTDVSIMNDSGYGANHALRNTCIWVGSLNSGSHTINGRRASAINAQTTTVDNRTLLIYIFNGDEFRYIDDLTAQTATSTTYIDDSVATATFTPSGSCKALAFYAITNLKGSTERYDGKKICINIDGADQYGEAAKSSNSAVTSPDSLATVYVQALTAVSTTIKGRLATNAGTQTVTANRHVLGVLLIDPSVVLDSVASVTPRSRALTTLANDDQASITRVRGATNELLIFGQATKQYGTTGSMYGLCYGLNVDDADVALSRSSPAYTSDAESSFVTYATTAAAGSHTINGRFATNYSDVASIVDTRILIALWFPIVTIIPATSSISGGGSLTASLFNIKRINSTVLGSGSQTSNLVTVNALLNISTGVGSHYLTSDGYYYTTSDNNDYLTHDGTLGPEGGGSQTAMLSINKSIASSINANASETANIIKFGRISSSLSGNGSQSSSIIIFTYLPIVSSISGAGSQNANVIEYKRINSTVLSVGSETAIIKEFEQIISLINGGGAQTSNPITFERISSVLAATGALTADAQLNTGTVNLYSFRTGSGLENANMIEFAKTTSTVTGGGLQNAALSSNQIITSSLSGGGTSTANIIEWNYISSNISGTGTSTANIREWNYISSNILGVGAAVANIREWNYISSNISGTGAATADIIEWNYISSNILGVGAAVANIIKWNYISSNISGIGSQTSDIALLEYIASVISGVGSTQAAVSINKNIYSIISGSGSQTANDIVFGFLNGIVIGIGHSSAHLTVIITATPHFDHPQTLIINQTIRAITIFRNERTVTIENGIIQY